MTQTARPKADVSNSRWSPTPLWKQIVQQTPNDSPFIQSAGDAGGDTFSVQLTPLAYPLPGSEQLTLRWALAQAGSLPITVTLLQSGNDQVAKRVLTLSSTTFVNQVIPLTPGEIAAINNYGQLSVQVSTAPPSITRRALGLVSDSSAGTTLTLSNVTVHAGELLVVGVGGSDVLLSGVTFNGTTLASQSALTAVNAGSCRASIYYLVPAGGDATGDIVATWSGPATARALAADAIAALPSGLLDKAAGSSGSGTSASSGTVSTSVASEYLHGLIFFMAPGAGGSYGLVWQNGFAIGQWGLVSSGTVPGALYEGYKIVSSTGSYAAAGTISPAAQWVALLATFR